MTLKQKIKNILRQLAGKDLPKSVNKESMPYFDSRRTYLMDCDHTIGAEFTYFKEGDDSYCAICKKKTKIVKEVKIDFSHKYG